MRSRANSTRDRGTDIPFPGAVTVGDMSRRGDFLDGVRTVAPVLVGLAPFGLVAGATAVEAGLSWLQAIGLSVVVFAGASQLAAIGLLGATAPLVVVVFTILTINLRMSMYSASLAPHVRDVPADRRSLMAYLLTDQVYALAVTKYREDDVSKVAFYMGLAVPLWVVWQICTVAGVVVGATLPDWLPLGFAVPLTFLALLVPAVEDRYTTLAAVVGGAVATAGAGLPFELGLLGGGLLGILAGFFTEGMDA